MSILALDSSPPFQAVDASHWSLVPASWGPDGEWPSPVMIPEEDWGQSVGEVDVLPLLVEYDSPEEGGFPPFEGSFF